MTIRFLIVDDNAQFLGAARDLLERQGATVVGVTSSGADALRLTRELRPDAVLVDVDLGAENGFDVAASLHGEADARVVMISAYDAFEFEDLIATSPAVGFVPKADLSVDAVTAVLGPS